ncbi:hypothetical protein predicted by Glimmer/Critica [Salmonella enterica subsp. enterica serovar Weltevreden str. 2007-60-3289-1]|nr:hypothetical protein predicted by Glimmer/Critica [Salmonella enterica subsp. enterica serovar Weltevreden str. 2007-60-3289-1]
MCQLRAANQRQLVFYFFALLNRLSTQVVSACLLVMHPDLLSAPAGNRGGGLKPQSG